jgi:hypothetical protein
MRPMKPVAPAAPVAAPFKVRFFTVVNLRFAFIPGIRLGAGFENQ